MREHGRARYVAAWPVEVRDEAQIYRVRSTRKNNWYCRGCSLRGDGGTTRRGEDDRHALENEIGSEGRQAIILTFRPAIFDCNVAARDKASLRPSRKAASISEYAPRDPPLKNPIEHKRRTMSAVHPMATELSQCRERCSEVPIATNAPQQTAHKERPPTAAINL